ncbi:NDP-hexose 2,3-dehydratase family protein [Streptomyces gobiensis]|uniref:NDP-hexose 2,3-dehydratase family protein n=1 Tax=Streptomyces gobiensis TaxID=2875706 RepID=UPI001E3AF0F2|nr:NDP-hexose 2,3-dehydratase family protein [Streptomyces gobiensis]UGY93007.1 NDP-hexose 2,3-dehydratase family protein [Streptomyces gobiensis]
MFRQTAEFTDWFAEQRTAHHYRVIPAPLDGLDGWIRDPDRGTLRHRTGGFFSIDGLEVRTDNRETESWQQPIIDQPESGILGILVKRFAGVPHFLMQAKMEPGNINVLQLSPTVQATRSNYTRLHRGGSVPYLEHFLAPRRGRIVFDALQSEQGSWFLHKRNRNMIVEVTEDVPVLDRFCWLTAGQIGELLMLDNVINMDARTVLAGWPEAGGRPPAPGSAREALTLSASTDRARHTDAELLSWFTEAKASHQLDRRAIALNETKGWVCGADRISHESGRWFSVLGVDVEAGSREVARWSQPMIQPSGRGVIAFVARRLDGVLHLLVKAHTEAGTLDVVEMGPTVQCVPDNYLHLPKSRQPDFLNLVLSAPNEQIHFDVVHSEEGGRFYHAENRYLLVEAGDDAPLDAGPGYIWMTVRQLSAMARHGSHVNVEARNLLACLRLMP